jgi:hypothetical protein
VSPIMSLTDWAHRRLANEPLPPETVEEFTKNVITTWDIPKSITEIGNGLLGLSNDDGMLRVWTNLSVAHMKSRTLHPQLMSFYERLEQQFLFNVGIQMQGVYLVMTAKTYGSSGGTVPESAWRYQTTDFVANTLQPEVDRFLWCVEKVVLAQGEWRSPSAVRTNAIATNADGTRVLLAGIGAPPEAQAILLRSELLGRRLIETFRDMRNYPDPLHQHLDISTEVDRTSGIYVHLFCREADLVNGQGPELTPWPGGAQKGRALPATGTAIPSWKGAENGYARLDKPESSRLRVVRYFWRWFDITGPLTPFTNGKTFKDILLQPSDFAAAGIDWPDIQAGHALDLTRLYTPPQISGPSAGKWDVSPLGGVDRYMAGEFRTEHMDLPAMTDDESRAYMLAAFALKGTQTFQGGQLDRREVFAVMSCPLFTYTGTEARTVKLHLWMSLLATRSFTSCYNFHMRGVLRVMLKGPGGDVLLHDSDTANNGKLSLWDKEISGGNVPPQATDEPVIAQSITVGATRAPEQYRLEIHARVGSQGVCLRASADIRAVIKSLSLSWSQA